MDLSRRQFIKGSVGTAAAAAIPVLDSVTGGLVMAEEAKQFSTVPLNWKEVYDQ